MDFSTLQKDQLREECQARGIPVSGTNVELIQRLDSYETERLANEGPDLGEDDLLGELTPEPIAPEALKMTDPIMPPQAAPPAAPEPATKNAPADPNVLVGNRYEVLFPCPGELSTGVHQENLQVARHRAEEAGHEVRGGAYSAHRSGWRAVNGVRHAVYEVPIRKE